MTREEHLRWCKARALEYVDMVICRKRLPAF